MRRIATETLSAAATLPRPLFHESGALLFAAGERLADEEIAALRRAGIRRVYDLGGEESGAGEKVPGEGSSSGTFPPLLVRGPEEPAEPPDEVRVFRREKRERTALRAIDRASVIAEARRIADPKGELRNGGLDRALARSREGDRPEGAAWRERLEECRPLPPRTSAEKAGALEQRRALVARLAAIMRALRAGGGPGAAPQELAKDLMALAARDPDLAIALALGTPGDAHEPPDDALARHAWNVGVFAVATAIELGYSLEQVFEIAAAALLHDVGMVRLPEGLAAKPAPLDVEEEKELRRHPLHAIEVLRRFPEVPLALAAVAYEEHERPDGSGYPRGVQDASEAARIVAVADHFDAIASPRPHRPARPPHEAVREVVALAAKKKLDAKVLRGLLKSVTLFPIGTLVRLSDGALARVVRAGGGDPARPVVARLVEGERPVYVDLAARPELKIAEADLVAPAGMDALAGF